jgi:hypothetical protein
MRPNRKPSMNKNKRELLQRIVLQSSYYNPQTSNSERAETQAANRENDKERTRQKELICTLESEKMQAILKIKELKTRNADQKDLNGVLTIQFKELEKSHDEARNLSELLFDRLQDLEQASMVVQEKQDKIVGIIDAERGTLMIDKTQLERDIFAVRGRLEDAEQCQIQLESEIKIQVKRNEMLVRQARTLL